jgi:hypothetical protein
MSHAGRVASVDGKPEVACQVNCLVKPEPALLLQFKVQSNQIAINAKSPDSKAKQTKILFLHKRDARWKKKRMN